MMNYFSDISLFWLIPAVLLLGGLTFWYYFKSAENKGWNKTQRWILSSLRFSGLVLLFLLLIGLVWESISYRQEKPLFITLVDDSSSMTASTTDEKLKTEIAGFQNELKNKFGERFDQLTLSFGELVKKGDTLNFKDKTTNLEAAFEYIKNGYFNRNIGGVALISDGNFNQGNHPMYTASELEFTPIFALGVGDTVQKRDVFIRSVSSNEVAFINNQFPVEAIVECKKVPKGILTVSLNHNGKVIATQKINHTNALFEQHEVLFTVDAKEKGFQRYTVSVSTIKGELTSKNNQQSCYIEILETKNLVYFVSSAPHPDLAAIRSVLEEDNQTTIKTALLSNYEAPKEKPSLVVWYENGSTPNAALLKQFIQQQIPVLMIISPITQLGIIKSYELGITPPSGQQQEDAQSAIASGFSTFEFTEQVTKAMSIYPPLRAKFGAYQLGANATVFLQQRLGNVVKKDPLMAFLNVKSTKVGVLFGEGIWRWKLKEFQANQSIEAFREFIQKTTHYLTVQQQKDPLRVTLPKRFYVTDNVEFKAEYYNEVMELTTDPELTLQLTDQGKKTTKLFFSTTSNFYKLNAGQLKPGKYNWTVKATYKGKTIQKSGNFIVEDIAIEQLTTNANFDVLNQLAKQSDGELVQLKDYQKVINNISNRKDIATVQYTDTGYSSMLDAWWIFVLLILIFSAEWFLRRFWGSY